MRRLIIPLLAAHSASFVALGISYSFCSRYLTPAEFGAYTTALAAGAFAVLVLDGGIRISVIKRQTDLTKDEQGGLLLALIAFAACLLVILAMLYWMHDEPWVDAPAGDELIASFAALYIISYPWIGISTALLERRLQYARIARIEAISMAVERLAPLVILFVSQLGLISFAVGLLAGRALRLALLASLAPITPSAKEFSNTRSMFGEGLWTQIGGGAAAVRDNLHVIIVGPLFGAAWVGYYGWAMQLGTMASQIFAQVAARIALPLAAQAASWHQRWDAGLAQIRILAAATAPLMAATILLAPWINQQFFLGKWVQSLPILALFCARMVPGVATSPLSPLLIVERGTRRYALASIAWTCMELGAAAIALLVLGSEGLAYSYAITAWAGIAILVQALQHTFLPRLLETYTALVRAPSVLVACIWSAVGIGVLGTDRLAASPLVSIVAAAAAVLSCLALDRELRLALLGDRRLA